jgi:hypothetical protein
MTEITRSYLVYENPPRYDPALKWLVAAVLGLTLAPGIALLFVEELVALVFLLGTLLDGLLFYIIIPRNYQVMSDHLRIVLGSVFSIKLRFKSIRDVRLAPSLKAYLYWGIRMAPSARGVIEIVRQAGLDVVISPRDSVTFLEQLNTALDNYRSS